MVIDVFFLSVCDRFTILVGGTSRVLVEVVLDILDQFPWSSFVWRVM